ncbi:MFS transporter [Stecheria intestinalis]|uniref:MFS transporter n=1 Tax=Stecheria intestinalis TaxID=2606630 RepID=UPI0023F0D5AB|nr:MFS transporter [Stecheria intestinalis]MDD5880955.1 MFS transporter [Stecheria intestinalis]
MKKETIQCFLMDGLFWAIMAIFYGYSTYYLRSIGYSSGQIGIMTAIGSILSALTQNVLGTLNDKGGWWNWKRIFCLMLGLTILFLVCLTIIHQPVIAGTIFILAMISGNGMMPFTVIICFEYYNSGFPVDYGKARAGGSLFYAIAVYLIGVLTEKAGPLMVPVSGIILCIAEGVVLMTMKASGQQRTSEKAEKRVGVNEIRRRYPAFFLMTIGLVLLFAFHNGTNTYLLPILERVGGDTRSLGTAFAISAITEVPVEIFIEKILKKISADKLLLISGFGFFFKGIMYLAAGSVAVIYLSQLLEIVSYAFYSGAAPYYANERIAPGYLSGAQAMMTSCTMIGAVLGNLTSGWIYEGLGLSSMILLCIGYAAAGTLIISSSLNLERKKGAAS